jgi:hypothetical protein
MGGDRWRAEKAAAALGRLHTADASSPPTPHTHTPLRPPAADGNPSKKKAPEKDPRARDRMQAMFAKAAGARAGGGGVDGRLACVCVGGGVSKQAAAGAHAQGCKENPHAAQANTPLPAPARPAPASDNSPQRGSRRVGAARRRRGDRRAAGRHPLWPWRAPGRARGAAGGRCASGGDSAAGAAAWAWACGRAASTLHLAVLALPSTTPARCTLHCALPLAPPAARAGGAGGANPFMRPGAARTQAVAPAAAGPAGTLGGGAAAKPQITKTFTRAPGGRSGGAAAAAAPQVKQEPPSPAPAAKRPREEEDEAAADAGGDAWAGDVGGDDDFGAAEEAAEAAPAPAAAGSRGGAGEFSFDTPGAPAGRGR